MDICVDDLKTSDIQALVNEWSISVSAKTIKNRNLERAKKLGIEFLKENMPY